MSRTKVKNKPYRIIGAYDSETTNLLDGVKPVAFPILHQLGIINGESIENLGADNVERFVKVSLFRHTLELFNALDEICSALNDYVPVICCHNLAFDMYGLSGWLAFKNVKVLAKSKRKPITFTILDDDENPRLVLWDTLVFSGQSLERMGRDCGYTKAVGNWDYKLVRTPNTPLTTDELDYAKRDIYTLLAWLGWWLRRNPDISPEKLGLNVVTKTGVVRELRKRRFDQIKGNGCRFNVGRYWQFLNKRELPKDNDELYTMHACTRGGFTFVASKFASVPFELDESDLVVAGYDATSQHPAQMVSKFYPTRFRKTSTKALENAFKLVVNTSIDCLLENLHKPFGVAFNAAFEIHNLRLKKDTLFEKWGIAPFSSARVHGEVLSADDVNSSKLFDEHLETIGYCDTCINPRYEFGKLVSCDSGTFYMTELAVWELAQCYDFESVNALGGYISTSFERPSDMSVISVMQFYKAKNEFKRARESYYERGTIDNGDALKSLGVAPAIVSSMENSTLPDADVDNVYLQLKASLNALFGIEASNEFRQDTILAETGIEYQGPFGVENAPKNPKAWYQFGQRIVGWSRIAQIIVLKLAEPYVKCCINGDTDSVKFLVREADLHLVNETLERYANALDRAKQIVLARVKVAYPCYYDDLACIGHYAHEFTVNRFFAGWNKAYAIQDVDQRDGQMKFSFTIAGIPARLGANQCGDYLYNHGMTFSEVCNVMLGYNVTFSNSIAPLNARAIPEWNSAFVGRVTDYQGNESLVMEPKALALYPMSKCINDTSNVENAINMFIAQTNNANVNLERVTIVRNGDVFYIERFDELW